MLNASFDLVGANLQLSDFNLGTHVEVSHDALTGSYQFNLSSGTWFDSSGSNTGSNVLNVLDSILTGTLSIDSALATNILLMGDLGSLDRVTMNTLGQVTDAPGTSLQTTSDLSINASAILLGETGTDSYQLGSLNVNSTGTAEVHAVGNLIVGSTASSDSLRLVADSLTLQSAISQADIFVESRTGDILVGSVEAFDSLTIVSAGSILDAQDDSLIDLQAGDTIDLRAAHDIQGSGANLFLELADGSRVIAESHIGGDIRFAGSGLLELEDVSTKDGSITVQALGTIRAIQLNSSQTDSADNFIHLTASGSSSDLIVHRAVAGQFNADVTLIAARNIVDGDMLSDDVDIIGHNVSIKAQSGWIGGPVGTTGDIFHESYQASTSLEIIWSDHLLAESSHSVILNPTLGSGSVTLLTPAAVLISNGDLNNAQIDTSTVINLAIIADANNDSNGIAILSNGPAVAGDLLVRGQDIASTSPLDFHADRFLIISGQAERFTVNSLNPNKSVQIDGQTTGTVTALSNGDVRLVDLNSDGSSLRSTLGSVLVSSQGGSIEVLAKLVSNQDLLLQAQDDIFVSNELSTTVGYITLIAGDDILINKSIESTKGGSICIEAGNSNADNDSGIYMGSGTSIRTSNSNVHISAAGEGNIQLQQIDVGSAAISLIAEGSILGASQSHLLIAKELRLEADSNSSGRGSIGQPDTNNSDPNVNALALQTVVSLLAAKSADGLYIINAGTLTIDTVAPVVVQCVTLDRKLVKRTDSSLSDLTSTHNGPIKLQARNGDLKINDGSLGSQFGSNNAGVTGNGSGDILLQALGNDSEMIVNSSVISQAGAIHVRATNAIEQHADLILQSPGDPVRNSILVESENGSISMSGLAVSRTEGGNIVYTSLKDVLLGSLSAGQGFVTVNSGGSILDAQSDTVSSDSLGFSALTGQPRLENIVAAKASLKSVNGIGQSLNPLDTSLDALAASSSGSVYILESNDLDIGTVQPVEATRIHINSTTSTRSSSNLVGIQATNGHAKIESNLQGDLNVTAAVRAANDVQLATFGTLTLDASVTSQTGALSLLAQRSITQNANLIVEVSTSAFDNSVFVQSLSGTIAMSANATTQSNAGNIIYQSDTDISLGRILAPQGNIAISAGGSVTDSQLDLVAFDGATGFSINSGQTRVENVVASSLMIRAATIGSANNPVDIDTGVLAVDAHGEIALLETNQVEIGRVAVLQSKRIHIDSTEQLQEVAALSGVLSRDGSIKLQSVDGDIIVSEAADVGVIMGQSRGVAASEAVLLAAGGTGDLVIESAVLSKASDVWLAAGGFVATPPNNPGTDQSATVQGDHLTIYAGTNVFLPNTIVNLVEARLTQARNASVPVEMVNHTADQAGTLILEDLQHGPTTTNPELTDPNYPIGTDRFDAWKDRFRFTDRFAEGYSLLIRNHNPLTVQAKNFSDSLSISGQAPGVYLETLSPSQAGLGASDLVITGQIELSSTLVNRDPGIVLIADGASSIRGSIDLLTPLVNANAPKTQTLNTLELNASAYHAGQGDPRFSNSASQNIPATTEYVVDPLRENTEDYRTHVSQRVLMEFGSDQESGFMTVIHYADNAFQLFESSGEVSKLLPGSDFVLQVGTNDERAIANTTDEAALFSRNTDFTTIDRFFLQNNRDLPTDVVIRRSLDFFVFSNAQSGDATEIVDHASYSQEILDVKSLGTSSMGPITPIPDGIRPPPPPTRGDAGAIERPLALTLPEVELRQVKSEVVEVSIYQISYDDQNHNGQVENVELPSFDSVLNRVDQDSKQTITSKNVGQSPTQGEIDEEKAKLLNSPDQPSGAYTIIRKNSDGKEEVLDVFSIRDWREGEESKEDGGGETLKQSESSKAEALRDASENDLEAELQHAPEDQESEPVQSEDRSDAGDDLHEVLPVRPSGEGQATKSKSTEHHSRFENAAALMSALWLLQQRTPQENANGDTTIPVDRQSPPIEYIATNRRLRRIKRLVRQISNQPEE